MSATQVLLHYPPGLKIRHEETLKITLRGQDVKRPLPFEDPTKSSNMNNQLGFLIQPRIRNLPPLDRAVRKKMVVMDSSALRKKLGHATVMIACAKQRMYRRRAALQAANLARIFNFTGEWSFSF
ncbi:hypothetical protein FRC18_000475 [Serendipita sp. 400]|nr:hypothetical protein FRC18_000475 [Serendipita sp. 400]